MGIEVGPRAAVSGILLVIAVIFGSIVFVPVVFILAFLTGALMVVGVAAVLLKYAVYIPYKDRNKIPTAIGIWIYFILNSRLSYNLATSERGQPRDFEWITYAGFFLVMGAILLFPLGLYILIIANPIEGKAEYDIPVCPNCQYINKNLDPRSRKHYCIECKSFFK